MSSLRARSFLELASVARSTAGYYFNASGALATAAIDEPRVDYDPATRAVRGLLLEETRTNLLLNSAALSTQNVTTSAQAYTLSFYGTGSVTLSGTSSGSLAGTGANTRVSTSFTPTAGTLTLTVSGSVLYAQLEVGAYPTSYISTAGATVQRTRDVATVLNPAAWLSDVSGTVLAEILMPFSPPSDGVLRRVFQFDDGTENNRICLRLSGATVYAEITAASSQVMSSALGSISANAAKKIAFAWSANDCAAVLAGNNLASDTSVALPAVTTARLGNASASGSDLSGYLRSLRYYPRRLSDNDLRALVA